MLGLARVVHEVKSMQLDFVVARPTRDHDRELQKVVVPNACEAG